MHKYYIVTGAAGFVGSHLYKTLKELGYPVLGIDDFSIYNKYDKGRKAWAISEKDIVNVDITDMEQMKNLANSLEFKHEPEVHFIHLAAMTGVRESTRLATRYIDVNKLRIVLSKCVVVEFYSITHRSAEILQENIEFRHQFIYNFLTFRFCYIENNTLLVAIHGSVTESPFRSGAFGS